MGMDSACDLHIWSDAAALPPSPTSWGSFSWEVDQGREAFVNKHPLQKAVLDLLFCITCSVSRLRLPPWSLIGTGGGRGLVKPKQSMSRRPPDP